MTGPHVEQPVRTAGRDLEAATAAVVLIHGRGATARGILGLADEFSEHDVAYLAPAAADNAWYPSPFTAPIDTNEPGRSSGVAAIDAVIDRITEADIPRRRVLLVGFSQGACLSCEYAVEHPARYGGLGVLSGGLLGETVDPEDYEGDLEETPVLLGCGDVDPHIQVDRVQATADVFEELKAGVTMRIYEGMNHTVNQDEIEFIDQLITAIGE